MRLAGKKIVITGASSGIGRAVAEACAREGAAVVRNYRRSAEAAEASAARLRAAGAQAYALGGDVGDPVAVDALVRESYRVLGGIDGWCNIAGADILTGEGARLSDLEKLARLIDTDLRGTMLCGCASAAVVC